MRSIRFGFLLVNICALTFGCKNVTEQHSTLQPEKPGDGNSTPTTKASRTPPEGDPLGTAHDLTQQMERTVAVAIEVARNPTVGAERRREAIGLLGALGERVGIEWLVENISLRIPLSVTVGEEQQLRSYPCFFVLTTRRDWRFAQAVMDSLDKPKSEKPRGEEEGLNEDLIRLARVLDSQIGVAAATALVSEQLERSPRAISQTRRENLLALKKYLPR